MSESPCEGIRLHFLLRRKLVFRCHPAGSLDSIFESRCKAKKKDTHKGVLFLLLVYTLDVTISIMHIRPHPYRVRPDVQGFSHGLKTCHRHVFLTAFRIPLSVKNPHTPKGVWGFLAEQKGFEPLHRFPSLRDFESRLFDQLEYCSI